jgi:hypothetical protein
MEVFWYVTSCEFVDGPSSTRRHNQEDHHRHLHRSETLKIIKEIGQESVCWIHLARGRDWWRALVNTAVTFGLHKRWGIYCPA